MIGTEFVQIVEVRKRGVGRPREIYSTTSVCSEIGAPFHLLQKTNLEGEMRNTILQRIIKNFMENVHDQLHESLFFASK